jgi:hypothetical protein
LKHFKFSFGRLCLFAVSYIPASYLITIGWFAWDNGTRFPISSTDLSTLVFAPLTVVGLLLYGMGNWFDGDKENNSIWWVLGVLVVVWVICYLIILYILRRRSHGLQHP